MYKVKVYMDKKSKPTALDHQIIIINDWVFLFYQFVRTVYLCSVRSIQVFNLTQSQFGRMDGKQDGTPPNTRTHTWRLVPAKNYQNESKPRSLEVCPQLRFTKKITKFLCHPEGKQAFP